MDSWASFIRSYNPYPEPRYLEARGSTNTTAGPPTVGLWLPMDESGLMMRRLQWPSYQAQFTEQGGLQGFNLSLNYCLSREF